MREILFRGQTRRFGEKVKNFAGDPMPSNWVYGGVCCGEGSFSIIYAYMDEEKEIPIEKHVVYTDTIGQYTGLTDKNGKKIFEGDIVEGEDFTAEDGGYGIVTFDEGAFEVVGSCDNNIVGTFHENYYGKDFEIIGNIHDNPELLKGE